MNAKFLHDPLHATVLTDWGEIPDMLEGSSHASGILLHKGPEGESECGLWVCTPGYWRCHVTRDEFAHFLQGACTYTHQSGDVFEVGPNTIAFFPEGWTGTCRVHETVKKVYMIR